MSGPEPVTIKFAVEGLLASAGRGRWTGSVGRFEASGSRKPDVLADLRQQVERAVTQRDLGSVLRVGVADGEVHVLASRYDGRYEITRSPLPEAGMWSEPRHTGPDVESRVNAGDVFVDRLERAHEGRDRRPVSTAESALRTLAASVGVQVDADDQTVDWREVAVQTARVFVGVRREMGDVQRIASESRALAELAGRGVTPEAQALARLLGLRGGFTGAADPGEVRREALAIVADMPGERFGGSLADARATSQSALRALDALTKLDGLEDGMQLRIDNGELIDCDDFEETAAVREWTADGPIDKAIAQAIEDESLPETAGKALVKLIEEKVQAAKDEWLESDAAVEGEIRDILQDALAEGSVDPAKDPERKTVDMVHEVCEALAKTRSGEPDCAVTARAANPLPEGTALGDIIDNAPRVRVWPLVGKGVHAVYDSSVGPLLSIETNDLETTLVSVADVLRWGRGKYGPLDHLIECVLTQDEEGDDVWRCAPDCPAAVVVQRDVLQGQLAGTLMMQTEIEDQLSEALSDIDRVRDELDNRGLLSALAPKVRALLENT